MSWERKKFIDFILLQRGYDLTQKQIIKGNYPVVTSTSILGYHNAYKANGPGVITGRSGTIGKVLYIESNYWPHNTSLYVKDFKGNDPKFVYYFMRNFGTARAKGGSAVPTLNKNNLICSNASEIIFYFYLMINSLKIIKSKSNFLKKLLSDYIKNGLLICIFQDMKIRKLLTAYQKGGRKIELIVFLKLPLGKLLHVKKNNVLNKEMWVSHGYLFLIWEILAYTYLIQPNL